MERYNTDQYTTDTIWSQFDNMECIIENSNTLGIDCIEMSKVPSAHWITIVSGFDTACTSHIEYHMVQILTSFLITIYNFFF